MRAVILGQLPEDVPQAHMEVTAHSRAITENEFITEIIFIWKGLVEF